MGQGPAGGSERRSARGSLHRTLAIHPSESEFDRRARCAVLEAGPRDDPGHATLALEAGGDIEGLAVEAPAKGYAVRIERGAATLRRLRLTGSGEAGLYFVGSQVAVLDSDFEGNQYGILSEGPSTLALEQSRFHGIHRAGIALVSTHATLKNNVLVGPFYEAALSVTLGDSVRLSGTRVTAPGDVGLKFVTSKAMIDGARVESVRRDAQAQEGYAIYSYQSTLEVSGLVVDDSQGVGVFVSGGRVTLRRSELHRCGEVAAYVGGGGALILIDSLIADGPVGLFVEPDGTADATALRYERVKQQRVNGK